MTKASTALGPVQKGSRKHTGRARGVGEEERGTGGCVDRRSDDATAVDVEINPQRRRLRPTLLRAPHEHSPRTCTAGRHNLGALRDMSSSLD